VSQAKTLTAAEQQQVLSYISQLDFHKRNRAMFLLGLYSGMRVGEIASLKVCDVVNSDGSIKSEIRLKALHTKGKQARTVFVSTKLQQELASFVKSVHQPLNMQHPLFITAGRRAFSANVMTQHFYWLFQRAGIAGASSHSMRRTFITQLASKGIGVRVLASLAGHKSIAVTQRYIDVNDDMKRHAVELI